MAIVSFVIYMVITIGITTTVAIMAIMIAYVLRNHIEDTSTFTCIAMLFGAIIGFVVCLELPNHINGEPRTEVLTAIDGRYLIEGGEHLYVKTVEGNKITVSLDDIKVDNSTMPYVEYEYVALFNHNKVVSVTLPSNL
jgi:hypothetical protein